MSENLSPRAAQSRPMLRFDIFDGPRSGETVNVPFPEPGEPPFLIGRSRECAIWIDAQNISRRHTEFFTGLDRRLMARDMGSVNGTLVNGEPISQTTPRPVNPGDQIRVGLSILTFVGVFQPQITASHPVSYTPNAPNFSMPVTAPTVNTDIAAVTNPATGDVASARTVTFNAPMHLGIPHTPPSTPLRVATLAGEYYVYLIIRGGQRYLLEGEEALVGRGQSNEIVIESSSISRTHARLQKTASGVYLQDLGSTNKSFVNDIPADSPILLRDGDVVRFGDVQADYKLEAQRLTAMNQFVPRLPIGSNPAEEQTFVGSINNASEQTMVGFTIDPAEQTSTGLNDRTFGAFRAPSRNENQGETAVGIDVQVVGKLRQELEAKARQQQSATMQTLAELENVTLTEGYGRNLETILNSVRLQLKAGEMVVLVGPSGSGKTQLLEIMAGLRPADRGKVGISGRNLPTIESFGGQRPQLDQDRELARWRQKALGYIPAETNLDPRLTAIEHVIAVLEQAGYGSTPPERIGKAQERLNFVGLSAENLHKARPQELTRMERKQVMLARALATEPALILACEPTGNLRSSDADKVFRLLRSLTSTGSCVFMVTSDSEWARNADRKIEILDGQIIEKLNPA